MGAFSRPPLTPDRCACVLFYIWLFCATCIVHFALVAAAAAARMVCGANKLTLIPAYVSSFLLSLFVCSYYMASASVDGSVKLWDLRKLNNFRNIDMGGPVYGLDFDSSGSYLVASGQDIRYPCVCVCVRACACACV